MTGIILLIVGLTGSMKYIKKYVPEWLIRGIQLGLALTLAKTALGFIAGDKILGLIAVAIIISFYFLPLKDISSLVRKSWLKLYPMESWGLYYFFLLCSCLKVLLKPKKNYIQV